MHIYRTHKGGTLGLKQEGQQVRLSGWVHSKRDHGNLVFIDLRDHYGLTQVVADRKNPNFSQIDTLSNETVICVTGNVVSRTPDTVNKSLSSGEIEIVVDDIEVLSRAQTLPMPINQDAGYPEDIRLRYRYLDLRREEPHRNIMLRSSVISSMRQRMIDAGFFEFQTPILAASSPEGARDFLVPSRLHPGKFYALPQAPQQFKQLIMMAGFDRYFQIAPCFRDEDARADRSPGEFYQLDFEMSFVTQEDVFQTIEPVLHGLFEEFADGRYVSPMPFPRISYDDALLKYGNDKPDLRNPLLITDVTENFRKSGFKVFAGLIEKGFVVRAISVPNVSDKPRSFFDKLNSWAQKEGQAGLGYIVYGEKGPSGPIARNLEAERLQGIEQVTNTKTGGAVFFVCGPESTACEFAGLVRTKLGNDLGLIDKNRFEFCWVVDFPMYEYDEKQGKINFSHNPFSMPQGGLEALETKDPLTINAWQYDIICNGIELSSGAIRNHLPEVMYKAFNIAGYPKQEVDEKFGGMISAMRYGAPPHGGAAPGIDRIVMLLANEPNIREVTLFPMNQMAQDLMMGSPSVVRDEQLKELSIEIKKEE